MSDNHEQGDDRVRELEELFLTPGERYIINHLKRQGIQMSDLTDKVDAALDLLASEEVAVSTVITNQAGVIAANAAAYDIVVAARDAALAGQVADEAELQKALDALDAANEALGANVPPATTPDPTTPDPTTPDPTTPDPTTPDPTTPDPTTPDPTDPSTPDPTTPDPTTPDPTTPDPTTPDDGSGDGTTPDAPSVS